MVASFFFLFFLWVGCIRVRVLVESDPIHIHPLESSSPNHPPKTPKTLLHKCLPSPPIKPNHHHARSSLHPSMPPPSSSSSLSLLLLLKPHHPLPLPLPLLLLLHRFTTSSSPPPPPPPIPSTLFNPPRRSGPHTQGDATYLSLARAYSDPTPPHIPSLLSLLSHMRSLPSRPSFPEYLFPPFFRAFAKSNLPSLALQLFDDLLPSFRCSPTVKSLNSALNVIVTCRPELALGFYRRAVRRHSKICPNVLSFNLLIKAAVRCSDVDEGVGLLREMGMRGLKPDVYSYSTVIDGLCRGKRVEEAMSLLDEMQA